MLHTRIAVTALVATSLLLAACSSDNGSTTPASTAPGATAGATTVPGATTPAVDPAATPAPVDPATSGGYCRVSVSGDVTAEWTSGGGYSSIGYGPWIAATGGGEGSPVPMDETFFLLNCQGDGENFVGFSPRAEQGIPMQPATYVIEPGDNAFGASESGIMSIMVGLDGTETNWGPSIPGELVITQFDQAGIAGTFSVTVTDVLAAIGGTPSKGTAVITGEFAYANPNL